MTQTAPQQERPAAAEALPEWNLDDLYPGQDSQELKLDLARSQADTKAFREHWQGRLADSSGAELADAIATYEAVQERLARLMSYAHLSYAADMANPETGRFFQGIQEKVTAFSAQLIFFTLELNRIDDAAIEKKLRSEKLRRYAPWIRDVRAARQYDLPEDIERLLHEKSVTGRAAWSRLFDETVDGLRFEVGGESLTSTDALNLLLDPDEAKRREAAKALGKVFAANLRLFAQITNTLGKDKEIEDHWRGYPRPVTQRNVANLVEDEVVDALVGAVRKAFPGLSHRYYALKAKWFGKDALDYWDRNAPLPDEPDRRIPWHEAKETVLDAYGRFSPRMAEVAEDFFERRWIDAPARAGKATGAFSHPTVPGAHPYILLNYHGRTRDVMTLAHELGHGVHQVLAAPRGHLMADTPLTLAETASVFGEMLTFRSLLDAEKNPKRRRAMLAGKVEDMLNTVVRQIAFHEFETRVHDERREGELLPERICEIWMDVQRESLGPAVRLDEDYRTWWTYIPHFIHVPFYVYAYAFGDCLVNSLYAVYRTAETGFADKYLDMLRAGGTLRHRELLAPFGLDASDPGFWDKGLGVIRGFIDELEEAS